MKLLVLGIDGLDYRYLSTWPYPHLSKWRDSAKWGTMWSSEKRTGPSWTTIFTGWTCGHHGITTLLGTPKHWNHEQTIHPPNGKVDSISYRDRPQDYLWDELIRSGYSAGITNSPGTPWLRNLPGKGFHIGGWPYAPKVFPDTLKIPDDYYCGSGDAAKRCPEALKYKRANYGPGWELHAWPWNEWVHWADAQERFKLDISERFANEVGGIDALIHVTQIWDRACHMLTAQMQGGKGTADRRLMKILGPIIDNWVGYAIKKFKPEAVAICSDHGFWGKWHSYQGIWGISGPNIKPGQIATIDQSDFTPTILDYMGITCGWGTDNKRDGYSVLKSHNPPAPYEMPEMSTEEGEDEDHQRRVLEGLGYIGEA